MGERILRLFRRDKEKIASEKPPVLLISRREDGGALIGDEEGEFGRFLELVTPREELVRFNTESLRRSQVFVSGPLTEADSSHLDFYERIGQVCQEMGLNPYIPHLSGTSPEINPDLSATEVVRRNREAVRDSGLMIATLEPSLGVGRELEIASCEGIPTILLKRRGNRVSRAGKGDLFIVGEVEIDSFNREALLAVESAVRNWMEEREVYIRMLRDKGYEI